MVKRFVIFTIDSVLELLRDYAGESADIPADAKIVKMRLDNASRKINFLLESDSWKGVQEPEEIKFDIRRIYSV